MIDYLMLIASPIKALDKLSDKKPGFLSLYLIFTITLLGLTLPKYVVTSLNNPNGIVVLMMFFLVMPLMYYPITYSFGYLYWIVAKGFKGASSFAEIRILIIYAYMPFIIQFIISIPFIIVGIIKNDVSIIVHDNHLSSLILWLLSFRILMVGIAKYNKFNWMITLITYLISTSILGGLGYLLLQLKR